jgi:hypothetical protein
MEAIELIRRQRVEIGRLRRIVEQPQIRSVYPRVQKIRFEDSIATGIGLGIGFILAPLVLVAVVVGFAYLVVYSGGAL